MTLFALIVTLWLLVGSIVMLFQNERTRGGVSRAEFVHGMVAWPWRAFLSTLEIVRLLLVL